MASIDEHRRRVMLVRACVGTTIEAELYLLAQARHVYKWVRARFQSADFCVGLGRLCVMYATYLSVTGNCALKGLLRRMTDSTTTQRYRGPRRPNHNQMKALCLLFHLVMVWLSGTSVPLSSGAIRHPSQKPLKGAFSCYRRVYCLELMFLHFGTCMSTLRLLSRNYGQSALNGLVKRQLQNLPVSF